MWLSALPSTCPEWLFLVVNWEVASLAGSLSPGNQWPRLAHPSSGE